ncbi:MAG TPA: NAD(P)/FAD-dependent oxidoreductase [Nocardioidaceae bacterium]|nr:NAD(P)/FAD-dependent oxidoreductase [Nocardioidaceae bacterium]
MQADAVVVGAGPNGLVAANVLADAGWQVLLLEAAPQVGGAVHSSGDVAAGFVHDTCSSFYPLAAGSPVIASLELERHGLRWSHAPAVLGHAFADGEWALIHRSPDETAAGFDEQHPGDGDAWLRMCADARRIGPAVVDALLSPMPPARDGLRVLTKLRSVGGLDFVRMLASPVRSMGTAHFGGRAPRMLLAGNALHTDIPLDAPGSGLMGWLLTMLGQHVGFPVPVGGASALSEALARRFTGLGGEIHCSTRVDHVVVRHGRAVAVQTAHGEQVGARRAVLTDVAAPRLYGGLVDWSDLPDRVRRRMARFEWDPGTIKLDWALDGPIPWRKRPAAQPGTVHIGESVDELSHSLLALRSGRMPDRPFVLLGQMTTADPSRSPAGTESAWAYTHLPADADVQRMAERVEARVEERAPGFGDQIRARRVLGPLDLEAHDENLAGGAINGGTSSLHQQAVFRPIPGLGRAETPVRRLFLASASAHPGGGVHGACGANAARAALAHHRMPLRSPAS